MSFKLKNVFQLRWLFQSLVQHHLCNSGRRQYEEHLWEIILRLGDVSFISLTLLWWSFVQQSEPFCEFSSEGVMGNKRVTLF